MRLPATDRSVGPAWQILGLLGWMQTNASGADDAKRFALQVKTPNGLCSSRELAKIKGRSGPPQSQDSRRTIDWANSCVDAVPPKSRVRTLSWFSV